MNLAELRTALQERREDYSQSDAKLGRRINQSYLDISSRRRWGWLRRAHAYATYAPKTSTAIVGIGIAGTENEKREVTFTGTAPETLFGKRVKVENDFYRVENIRSTTLTLDRPLRCTASGTHYVKIMYNEVALPVGTISVVNCSLFRGGAASYGTPLSMSAISPSEMAYLDMDVEGRPTRFSTTRKEPIPPPQAGPTCAVRTATSTSLDLGTYKYWLTHVDKQSGAESALSPATTLAVTTPNNQSVSVGTNTARSDFFLRLYRSRVGGDTPYLLNDPQNKAVTYVDSVNDNLLGGPGPNSASSLFMQLYPIPDDEYEIRSIIQIECTPMSSDNDRPLFDAEFHHIILDGAEALMLDSADEQGRASSARQRFEMGIARMIQLDRTNLQNNAVFGGRPSVRGRRTWQYSTGTSEADFKA